ncbi:hypothetical protein CHLNCDRAFT_142512 [Chlorella variabilis]|uniref:Proteasome alpha-type subunits domain-containing protein n=1 Tax=Chlorella variabilis TaxID=554065 RepID=E1ZTT3_CHLVA|nr:hypothetical protein CHLNCDRAFT_142512 [Chlorella variabilis]EFN50787.1 hypothetical protein CHLNCDRAFT_142512 [Chlorella variabilis]|eukprot:XP_005852324.1 hypothetical protein CHLNCDRAFT_142512 [Chlorella variabilis]
MNQPVILYALERRQNGAKNVFLTKSDVEGIIRIKQGDEQAPSGRRRRGAGGGAAVQGGAKNYSKKVLQFFQTASPATMCRTIPLALALLACLAFAAPAHAGHLYTGPGSFINSFTSVAPIKLPGAELRLVTAGEIFGLNLAGLSALHIKLSPCTILQPHTHPHAEFVFTISGKVVHSTPYNNKTLTGVVSNTKAALAKGFAVFPAGQLHVTQNDACTPAELIAFFPAPAPDLYFYPYTEAYLPANTLASFFGGKVKAGDAWKPVGTAKLGEPLCLRSMLLKYDTDVTTWSPQGRIFQIEYAMEAVKQGSAAVGLKSNEYAVLATLKRAPSELSSYQRKQVPPCLPARLPPMPWTNTSLP